MIKKLDKLDSTGIGTVGVYEDEQSTIPIRTFKISAKPNTGQELYDALIERMNVVDTDSVIPQTVSMRQARLELYNRGILDTVQSLISSIGGTAEIEWNFADSIDRDWPLVSMLASQLNLSDSDLDLLFESAYKL